MGDPNDNESNHQTDGRDPLQGGRPSRSADRPVPARPDGQQRNGGRDRGQEDGGRRGD